MTLGCAGSETGNGERSEREKRPVSVEMRLEGPEGPEDEIATRDRGGVEFVIESAVASVERIDFIMPAHETCAGLPLVAEPYAASCGAARDRVRLDGPWTVDLLSGEFEPVLEGIEVLEGAFASIEARLWPGDAGVAGVVAGSALDGAALDVSGHVALGGRERPFGLTLDIQGSGRFMGVEAVTIGPESDAVELTFEVLDWFSTLDLGSCIEAGMVPTEGGVLRLEQADRRVCGDIERALRQALADTGRVSIEAK
jgi:hypothetical protein